MHQEQQDDLNTARYLAECGVPIFLARPKGRNSSGHLTYTFPPGWQKTKADPKVLDQYKPGMAVCAVMGYTVDGVDKDPRSGGDLPAELQPKVYGRQTTPSGGTHDLVAPLGVNSKNGVLPGVDVKAGLPDKTGRGFLFIAPTMRTGKEDGQDRRYKWETRPDLDQLMLIGGDESGKPLADYMEQARSTNRHTTSAKGLSYDQLSPGQQSMATEAQASKLDLWKTRLEDAEDWVEGHRDESGRGWEELTSNFAWVVASCAVTPWMPLTEDEAKGVYDSILPEAMAKASGCENKFHEGILDKASEHPYDLPPWSDFGEPDPEISKDNNLPKELDEVAVARWLAESGLSNKHYWTPGLGWLRWDNKRWKSVPAELVRLSVSRAMKLAHGRAKELQLDRNIVKKFSNFLTDSKTKALTSLVQNEVVQEDAESFDNLPHLLNVQNGVVDLRTGELKPHDPKYMFTKVAGTDYDPEFEDADWEQVLQALDSPTRKWMQIRFGQAATGHPTPDAVVPIGQGSGSNGKTTLITAIRNALGGFQTTVPDRVLMANPSDHPTELTTLFGVRAAFIDELPEGRYLNVQRLKSLAGSSRMNARKVHKDNIEWDPTHSLFVMTNYAPQVAENDDGATRRLALVKFNKKFPRDDAFYARVTKKDGPVTKAALTWLVEGAKTWYASNVTLPPLPDKVQTDTNEWLEEADPTNEYIQERLVLDPNSAVLAKELNEDISNWLMMNSMKSWSRNLAATRLVQSATFQKHGIRQIVTDRTKKLMGQLDLKFDTEVGSKVRVFRGIRWRKQNEPMGFDPTDTPTPEFAQELI